MGLPILTIDAAISLLKDLSLLSPGGVQSLLGLLDPAKLNQLATWAKTLVDDINNNVTKLNDPDQAGDQTDNPILSGDFISVNADSKYKGIKLTQKDLDDAGATMAMSLKAENWEQAVMVGIAIAQYLPLAA